MVARKIIMFDIFGDVRTGKEIQKYVGDLFSCLFSVWTKKKCSKKSKLLRSSHPYSDLTTLSQASRILLCETMCPHSEDQIGRQAKMGHHEVFCQRTQDLVILLMFHDVLLHSKNGSGIYQIAALNVFLLHM